MYKIYKKNNYIIINDGVSTEEYLTKDIFVREVVVNVSYEIYGTLPRFGNVSTQLLYTISIPDILKENDSPYSANEWIDFYTISTGILSTSASGTGDASAANQVIANTKLTNIDSKLPTLINNTQPTSLSGVTFNFSTVNSSSAQLAASATFTGIIEDTKNQPSISLLMVSDQNMIITVLQYIDLAGTKLVSSTPFTVYAGNNLAKSFPINGNYVNITVKNIGASTTTTFQLDTAFGIIDASDGSSNIPVAQVTQYNAGNITVQNSVPNGIATANSAIEISLNGASTLSIQTTGTYTGALSLQVTNDNSRWETVTSTSIVNMLTGAYVSTIASATIGVFQVEVGGFLKARITALAAVTGTAVITLRSSNSTSLVTIDNALPVGTNSIGNIGTVATVSAVTTLQNGQTAHSSASTGSPLRVAGRVQTAVDNTLVAGDACDVFMTSGGAQIMKPFAVPELDWTFACTAPVANTTDVVLKTAVASNRNYITSFQITNASATIATEVVIKDGVTVIWRGYVGVGTVLNSVVGVTLSTPLKSTVNTALNFACITTASSVYINAQGYVAP